MNPIMLQKKSQPRFADNIFQFSILEILYWKVAINREYSDKKVRYYECSKRL